MPKRLIAAVVAVGALALSAPSSASASFDATCAHGKNAAINVPLTVPGLLHLHLRLFCS